MSRTLYEKRTTSVTSLFFGGLCEVFQKDSVVTIGKGEILNLFEEIPFRPPQGSHVTHVWEDIGAQIIFSRTLWRSKAVLERRVANGVGDEHKSCLQVQWTDFMGSRLRCCRIIMICNVKYSVQTYYVVHNEAGTGEKRLKGFRG